MLVSIMLTKIQKNKVALERNEILQYSSTIPTGGVRVGSEGSARQNTQQTVTRLSGCIAIHSMRQNSDELITMNSNNIDKTPTGWWGRRGDLRKPFQA